MAKQISKSALCPCGRGKRYGKCCAPHGIKWFRDAKGQLQKSIPLSREAARGIECAQKEFERIYRRQQTGADRIMPWSYLTSDADMADQMAETLKKANVRAELAYATNKTGMILTTENEHMFSASDLAEWDAAIAEYHSLAASSLLDQKDELDKAIADLEEEFYRIPYILAMFVYEAARPRRGSRLDSVQRQFAFYYGAKSVKSLQAVGQLRKEHLPEDMLTITRTIYENYLHILFAVREQEKHAELLRAQVGREIGTHSFARTKTGKIDRRYLVERETGRVTPASYSTFKMACCSPWAADRNLYELLYGSLSEFTHPHPVHVARFFDESGVNFRNRFQTWEANLLANAAALMTADALLNVGGHPRRPRADVLALLRHFKSAFSHYMGLVPTDAMGRDDLDLIWRRVKRLGQKWAGQESASEDAT